MNDAAGRWAELASVFLVEMQGVFGLTQPSMLEITLQVRVARLIICGLSVRSFVFVVLVITRAATRPK